MSTIVSNLHYTSHRFPGQRGRPSEVVDIPSALQIIMLLPGKTAARVRVKASYLLTRFLAGDLRLISEIYGMNELQEVLKENDPTHDLCAFRQAKKTEIDQTWICVAAIHLQRSITVCGSILSKS